jgi:hypothetical protein
MKPSQPSRGGAPARSGGPSNHSNANNSAGSPPPPNPSSPTSNPAAFDTAAASALLKETWEKAAKEKGTYVHSYSGQHPVKDNTQPSDFIKKLQQAITTMDVKV